jgi:hypothetical protein
MDYCVEPEIAPDREEVRDRISRTIGVNRDCWRGAHDRDIAHRFMPVVQGRVAGDYENCIDALGDIIDAVLLIGIGSMCRRPVGGSDGVIAIFEHLDRILGEGTMLHAFGIKGTALSSCAGSNIASRQSTASIRNCQQDRSAPARHLQDRCLRCRSYGKMGPPPICGGPPTRRRQYSANCHLALMTAHRAIRGRGQSRRHAPKSGR